MSLTIAEEKRFFASKPNPPHRITMGGKVVKLANFPEEKQKEFKKRIAEKDEVMARGLAGEIPGLKIDGKQVTRDNIKDFEIPEMKRFAKTKSKKVESKKVEVKSESKKYTEEELNKMGFFKLKKLAKSLGETGRSKAGLIKDILKHM